MLAYQRKFERRVLIKSGDRIRGTVEIRPVSVIKVVVNEGECEVLPALRRITSNH